MNSLFNIDERIRSAADKAMEMCREHFAELDRIQEYHQLKMLKAFQQYNVSESMFAGSTGYGYDDPGRDMIEKVYAGVLKQLM